MTKHQKNETSLTAENSYTTKKIAILGVVAALAYVAVILCRLPIIPSVPFLDLEFKSAIILIGAFMFGPLAGFSISTVVCIIEMLTISTTGVIGCIMNILATICLVCPAAFIYKKKRTLSGAIAGLAVGAIAMTAAMVLWNYAITPMYMGVPREAVVQMLIPAFIPFNLIKAALNGSVALLLYKFVVTALRKAKLIPQEANSKERTKSAIIGSVIVSCLVILTCVLIILAFNGVF